MAKIIIPGEEEGHLEEAVEFFRSARKPAALSGAGISVESGIPDFRSPGGLWSVFSPDEYATLDVFMEDPDKAWDLYRALGESLEGKEPNPAHRALAALEREGRLGGIITQNVDGLHQAAGSREVIEIHGDHRHLQCLGCGRLERVRREHLTGSRVPVCPECDVALKPNVVLFGEDVRGMERVAALLEECDLLMVIGTSAQVYPAAGLPGTVKQSGGLIFEFNREPTGLTKGETAGGIFPYFSYAPREAAGTDYLFLGNASETVTLLADRILKRGC